MKQPTAKKTVKRLTTTKLRELTEYKRKDANFGTHEALVKKAELAENMVRVLKDALLKLIDTGTTKHLTELFIDRAELDGLFDRLNVDDIGEAIETVNDMYSEIAALKNNNWREAFRSLLHQLGDLVDDFEERGDLLTRKTQT
jgi:hypothetical protein